MGKPYCKILELSSLQYFIYTNFSGKPLDIYSVLFLFLTLWRSNKTGTKSNLEEDESSQKYDVLGSAEIIPLILLN